MHLVRRLSAEIYCHFSVFCRFIFAIVYLFIYSILYRFTFAVVFYFFCSIIMYIAMTFFIHVVSCSSWFSSAAQILSSFDILCRWPLWKHNLTTGPITEVMSVRDNKIRPKRAHLGKKKARGVWNCLLVAHTKQNSSVRLGACTQPIQLNPIVRTVPLYYSSLPT